MTLPTLRFKLDREKCVEGIQLLAAHSPGITQYYIGKVFFFADRKHLLDWGRPISGDRYVAMEHGPVPSYIYDLVKLGSGEPDEVEDELARRVNMVPEGNKIRVFEREPAPEITHLSASDREYLLNALSEYKDKSFGYIKTKSHEDTAYEAAWSQVGLNNEMDISLWFDREQVEYLLNNSSELRRKRIG
jgi:uncharacterized phage-associated protein